MFRCGRPLVARLAAASPSPASPTCSTLSNSTHIASSSVRLSPPYPTEGGHVPIYSMCHGLVQKRNWVFRNPDWCELCREPVAVWVNHMSRKDHALMDQHYTVMMEFPRRWNPQEVLEEFMDALGPEVQAYHANYARYDRQHRNELYAMLVKLEEAGMLYFDEPKDTYLFSMQGGLRGMDHQGALVLHQFILGPFMRLFPDGHIQDYSNLVDFVTCSYNMETVYDLCGMYTLDKVALRSNFRPSSPAAMGLGGIASSSVASSGFEQPAAAGNGDGTSPAARAVRTKQQEDLDEEAFSRKAVFVRQILGQMRWLLLPGQEHPAGFTFPPHIITLGEICVKALVAQIIAARLCEYVVRAEPVWRSFGFERKKLDLHAIAAGSQDVLPSPVKYTYRRMSPQMDDLYTCERSVMDEEIREELRRKGAPIPPALAEPSFTEAASSTSTTAM